MANIITVKKKRKILITRHARGEGIIRLDAEATDLLEELLKKTDGDISAKELASGLIKYAANDTIIKVEEGEGEDID